MKYANFQYFEFYKLPVPNEWGPPIEGRYYLRPPMKKTLMKGSSWYRIATHFVEGKQKPQMWSFRLSAHHVVETLVVIKDHLDSVGVEWLWLCNAHGNPLPYSCLRSSPK